MAFQKSDYNPFGVITVGPAPRVERDWDAERAAEKMTADQVAKEFFATREAFTAAAEREDFPRVINWRMSRDGRSRSAIYSRSALAAWRDKQIALVASLVKK
jgi:hypothetical protein